MKKSLSILAAVLLAAPGIAGAQMMLENAVSPRAVAMGHTGVADNTDPANVYFNPAHVIARSRIYLVGSQQRWEELDDGYLRRGSTGVSWRGDGAVMWGADFTFARMSWGESVTTDPAGAPLGMFTPHEDVASLAFGAGTELGAGYEVRVGMAVKRWAIDYGPEDFTTGEPYRSDGFAVDGGLTLGRQIDLEGWSVHPAIGLAMLDMGGDIEWPSGYEDPLFTRFVFGTSVRIDSPLCSIGSARVPLLSFVFQGDGVDPTDGDFEWGIGNELAVARILFLRAGVQRVARRSAYEPDPTYGCYGAGLGIPLSSFRVRFDYARRVVDWDRDRMGLTLAWVF